MIVDTLFEVFYGNGLELNRLKKSKAGVNFVARTSKNNGVTGIVELLKDVEPLDAGLITVAASGSVLSSFVQSKPFYTAYHVFCLKPRKPMTLSEKLFYCMCINANSYRYSFGRQANRTLKLLKLPEKIPKWVKNHKIQELSDITKSTIEKRINLIDRKWKPFTYDYLFDIKIGKGARKKDVKKKGKTPFITSIDKNNGLTGRVNVLATHQGNVITVNRNGSVGEAFYQSIPFCSTEDVHVFISKNFKLNQFIAMFLICLIRMERFRYSFGRKWGIERMYATTMKLPVNEKDEPDWMFIENYIKSLPYSYNLQN